MGTPFFYIPRNILVLSCMEYPDSLPELVLAPFSTVVLSREYSIYAGIAAPREIIHPSTLVVRYSGSFVTLRGALKLL